MASGRYKVVLGLCAILILPACTGVSSTQWTRRDGSLCETDSAKPVFFAGALVTGCTGANGKGPLQPVPANEHDIGMMAGLAAILGLIGGSL